MTIKFCSLNAWGSRSNTENTHDAIASLEKFSHRCVFFWCGACGAVYAAAGEQDEKEDGGDHIHAGGFASTRINFVWASFRFFMNCPRDDVLTSSRPCPSHQPARSRYRAEVLGVNSP